MTTTSKYNRVTTEDYARILGAANRKGNGYQFFSHDFKHKFSTLKSWAIKIKINGSLFPLKKSNFPEKAEQGR